MTTDKIHINDLVGRCIIGLKEEERQEKQEVIINITLFTDLKKAAKTDSLEDTIDYSQLKGDILNTVENSKFHLIESLAEEVADICLKNKKIKQVKVSVQKPGALRFTKSAEVEITRSNAGD